MNFQVLPNWCKKLGVILFIVGTIIGGIDDFIEGWNEASIEQCNTEKTQLIPSSYFSENTAHFFLLISMVGLLIYLLSKEKIEDDYIDKLRLESYQITALLGLSVTIVLYAFSEDIKLTLDYFIILFLWTYLITFAVKKRLE